MSQHTPEPWTIYRGDNAAHCGIDGAGVFEKQIVSYQIEREEDARRIVACVNACVDIETEKLEGIEPLAIRFAINGRLNIKRIMDENDELREALNLVDAYLSKDGNLLATPNSMAARSTIKQALGKESAK